MAEKTDFMAGLVVGALVGIGLGILFAPQSGQQTREKIRGKADEMSGRLRETADDVSERVRTTASEVTGRVRETAGDVASKMRETLDEQTQRIRGAYKRGREAMQQKRDDILTTLEDKES